MDWLISFLIEIVIDTAQAWLPVLVPIGVVLGIILLQPKRAGVVTIALSGLWILFNTDYFPSESDWRLREGAIFTGMAMLSTALYYYAINKPTPRETEEYWEGYHEGRADAFIEYYAKKDWRTPEEEEKLQSHIEKFIENMKKPLSDFTEKDIFRIVAQHGWSRYSIGRAIEKLGRDKIK